MTESSITKEMIYDIIPKKTLTKLFKEFELNFDSRVHGFTHWVKVIKNGEILSKNNGANLRIIIAFGFFHDIKREDDFEDFYHGNRAAELLLKYRKEINLTDAEIQKLYKACAGHTSEKNTDDLDIGACWDADRLELYRLSIVPKEEFLNSEYSKRPETIKDACYRSVYEKNDSWSDDIFRECYIKN